MIKESKKIEFTEYNFLELLVSVLRNKLHNSIINKSELEKMLADYYDKPEFKVLFSDIIRKAGLDYKYVDLSESFLKAQTWGLLQLLEESPLDMRYIINISDEESEKVINKFDTTKTSAMLTLVESINKRKILETEYEPIQITDETRKYVLENPDKFIDCPPRIRTGNFYTDEEAENYINESLNRSLPDDKPKVRKKKKDQ